MPNVVPVDAAESHLTGDVGARVSAGAIRYRIWPARRHPILATAGALVAIAATAATFHMYGFYWALLVATGLILTSGMLLFPTLVSLDGPTLHIRHLGTPRTWDLKRFERIDVGGQPLRRVELGCSGASGPMDTVHSVRLPLPADSQTAEKILVHLRRWIARRQTGHFELDEDQAPEDSC